MRRCIIRMLHSFVIINRQRTREYCLENLFFHVIGIRRGEVSLAADVMSVVPLPVTPFPADVRFEHRRLRFGGVLIGMIFFVF